MNKEELIQTAISRGVEELVDKKHFEEKLRSGKTLRIKLGIDPTSPNIHLGRSIPLLKLRDFQNLGHQIVFIIGDFTGQIGDTSDKDSERPMLTEETIKSNLKTYIDQAAKIIDVEKAEIHYNSTWLGKLGYSEIGRHANEFSLNEFISRENIKRRLDEGKRVSLRELLYPLMQGYDSVAVKSDLEIGGTDQRFNLLAGRDLQRAYGQEPQDILTNPIIEGLDGRKMSSSYGNTVNLKDSPNDMFGKIMTLHDDFIIKYFTLLTRVDLNEIAEYEKAIKGGANPRDYKMKLGKAIVTIYHSKEAADEAEQYFINTFTKKEIPDDIEEVKVADYELMNILLVTNLVASKGEARRIAEQNGIKIDGEHVSDLTTQVKPGSIIQRGKLKFVKVI